MNKVYKLIALFVMGLLILSCSKDDNKNSIAPKRDYAEQYADDNDSIVKFLKTHYMEVVDDESLPEFGDVTFTEIPTGGSQVAVWDETADNRKLRTRLVNKNDITYTVYYISFREGVGISPCNVDGVYANYKGTLLDGSIFDQSVNPQILFNLPALGVSGWGEIFPKFKSGTYVSNSNGTVTYDDYGAGVMFLPSGLGYYNIGQPGIPGYSPLIFSIKLLEIKRLDQDGDGILSYLEDLNGDGYLYSLGKDTAGSIIANPDNTDGDITLYTDADAFPDFLDGDDDADRVLTKTEILNPITNEAYPFADIPTCGGTGNGKKKYLDKSCQ